MTNPGNSPDPRAATLARSLETALPLFTRFLAGFDDSNRTHQAPGIPNHCAWTLGHLALYHHRTADRLLGTDEPQALPADDFVSADGRGGSPDRVDTELVCYGSTPTDDPSLYPGFDRLMQIHDRSWQRLIDTVRSGDASMFDRAIAWGSSSFPGEQLVTRMIVHLGTHAGQICDLRRGLEMPRVIG